MNSSIVVAVTDPAVHPEVVQIVAATGQKIIDVRSSQEVRRAASRCSAVVVDRQMASELGGRVRHSRVVLVERDPGPVDWQCAVEVGAAHGFVVPAQAPELLKVLGERGASQCATRNSVGVLGAVGGSGASVLAAALARAQGEGAVLIDADPHSGGLDLLLGMEQQVGARWNDVNLEKGAVAAEDLWGALPTSQGLGVLTHSRSKGALPSCSAAGVCSALETLAGFPVVVDLSVRLPGFGDVLSAVSSVVLVIPAELRAVAAASSLATAYPEVDFLGVVRYRGWSGMDRREVGDLSGIRVVAEVPSVPGLAKQLETKGLVRVPRGLSGAVRALNHEL